MFEKYLWLVVDFLNAWVALWWPEIFGTHLALVAVPSQCGLYWFLISVSFVFTNQTNGSLDAKIVLLVIHCWIRVSIIIRIPYWNMLFSILPCACWTCSLSGGESRFDEAEVLEWLFKLWSVDWCGGLGRCCLRFGWHWCFWWRITRMNSSPTIFSSPYLLPFCNTSINFLLSVWPFRWTLSLTCSTIRSHIYEITLVLLLSYLIDRTVACIPHNLLHSAECMDP